MGKHGGEPLPPYRPSSRMDKVLWLSILAFISFVLGFVLGMGWGIWF